MWTLLALLALLVSAAAPAHSARLLRTLSANGCEQGHVLFWPMAGDAVVVAASNPICVKCPPSSWPDLSGSKCVCNANAIFDAPSGSCTVCPKVEFKQRNADGSACECMEDFTEDAGGECVKQLWCDELQHLKQSPDGLTCVCHAYFHMEDDGKCHANADCSGLEGLRLSEDKKTCRCMEGYVAVGDGTCQAPHASID